MQRRPFGKTDMMVSALGFGGSPIGFRETSPADVSDLLNRALDLGLNVIDTAECYRDSEEKIGKAVGHRRDEFYIFTKCGHASGMDSEDWDPKMLALQIDRSLQRLQTDRVDLIQLHSCQKELLESGEVIDVLRRAKEAGKTRYIGYSGDNDAALYAVECGAFDALQCSVNIADQEAIDLFLPRAAEAGMGVIAKRPLANVAWERGADPSYYGHEYWERLQELNYPFLEKAEAHRIALQFTLTQPAIATAIVGTTKPDRYAENIALLDSKVDDETELKAIRDRWLEVAKPDWRGST